MPCCLNDFPPTEKDAEAQIPESFCPSPALLKAFITPSPNREQSVFSNRHTWKHQRNGRPALQMGPSFLNADNRAPRAASFTPLSPPPPAEVSIPSNPFHALQEHLCPACLLSWDDGRAPVVWRCSRPPICHVTARGWSQPPPQGLHQPDRHLGGRGGEACPGPPSPPCPPPPPPMGRKAGLLRGVGGFLARVNGAVSLPRAFLFSQSAEVLSH